MPNLKKPTYETNPLRVRLHDNSSSQLVNHGHTIDFPSYADKPIGLEDLNQKIYSLGKGAVEVALYKSPSNEGRLKFVTMGWGGNFNAPIARLEAAEIAKQNPDTDLAIINNPGSGDSSPIPHSIMKEIKQTGSFMPYGELVADAVRELYQDYDQASISGHSMGARTGIAFGRYLGPVEYITATDPPGSRELGLIGLANAFMITEGAHAGEYAKHTDNTLSLELQRQNDALGNTIKNIVNMGPRGAAQMFFNQTGAMSGDGLKTDLELLLKSRNLDGGTLQINSPEFSELNHPEDMRAILTDLADKYPGVDIQQATLLGQTHSVNTGGNSHTVGALSRLIK